MQCDCVINWFKIKASLYFKPAIKADYFPINVWK